MTSSAVTGGAVALEVQHLLTAVGQSQTIGVWDSGRVSAEVANASSSVIPPYIKTKPTVLKVLWGVPTKYTVKKWTGAAWVISPLERPLSYAPTGNWATERKWDGQNWVSTLPSEAPAAPSGTWVVKRRWNGIEWEVLGREWVA